MPQAAGQCSQEGARRLIQSNASPGNPWSSGRWTGVSARRGCWPPQHWVGIQAVRDQGPAGPCFQPGNPPIQESGPYSESQGLPPIRPNLHSAYTVVPDPPLTVTIRSLHTATCKVLCSATRKQNRRLSGNFSRRAGEPGSAVEGQGPKPGVVGCMAIRRRRERRRAPKCRGSTRRTECSGAAWPM